MTIKREKLTEQFHRLTVAEIKQWYKDELVTTSGYLFAIKKITKPPGTRFVIPNVTAFCKEWEISKSAFYRAVDNLQRKGYMNWEATHGLIFTEPTKVVSFSLEKKSLTEEKVSHERDTQSHERDTQSHERDTQSHERDTQSHERDTQSHERENQALKGLQTKDSEPPQIYSEFSEFIEILSQRGEREKFLEFGRRSAANLPDPLELPDRWIAKYHEELYRKFKAVEAIKEQIGDQEPSNQEKQQKILAIRKAANEFLHRDRDPVLDQTHSPAPQNEAAQPPKTESLVDVPDEQKDGAQEPKTGVKKTAKDYLRQANADANKRKLEIAAQKEKEVTANDRDATPSD